MIPKGRFASFGKLTPDAPKPLDKNLYIVHLINWVDSSKAEKETAKVEFVSSEWFVYQFNGKQYVNVNPIGKKKPQLPEIYGQTSAVFLSISRIIFAPGRDTAAPYIDYAITTKERTADNVVALEALIGGILNIKPQAAIHAADGSTPQIDVNYRFSIQAFTINAKPLRAPFDVAIKATATPTKPSDPSDQQQLADAEKKKQTQTKDDTQANAQTRTEDCTPLSGNKKCAFSQTVTVDSRKYWDVGVNIVVHGPRENKYALSNSNIVTQSHTIHSALIGTFDFSPWAYKLPMNKYPYLQIGLPLSGSAFHLPYCGVSLPTQFTKKWIPLSVYGGVGFMKQTFPKTLAVGATSNTAAFNADLTSDWAVKAIYGIEVPVSSIISAVKSGVGGGKSK
jgi:hypothetical protein